MSFFKRKELADFVTRPPQSVSFRAIPGARKLAQKGLGLLELVEYDPVSILNRGELLESASARIEETNYDNWNGGTYTYTLMLDIPVAVFATIEPKLPEIEKSISSKLSIICRGLSNEYLDSVTITPLTSKSASVGPKAQPASIEVKHLWTEGFFRLFVSHVSAHKVAVAALKSELGVKTRGARRGRIRFLSGSSRPKSANPTT